mgnify:FL=1
MPRGDGSGPQGQGPVTGRGLGPCGSGSRKTNNPTNNPQPMDRGPERGAGRGLGRQSGAGQAPGGGRGLRQRMARGFNNLRQRARARKTRRGGGRRNMA